MTEAREMKQREETGKDMPGQMSFTEDVMPGATGEGEEEPEEEEETPTEGAEEATEGKQEDFMNQPEEYEDPQPEISLLFAIPAIITKRVTKREARSLPAMYM